MNLDNLPVYQTQVFIATWIGLRCPKLWRDACAVCSAQKGNIGGN